MSWPSRFKPPVPDFFLLLGVTLLFPDKFSPVYFLTVAALLMLAGGSALLRKKPLDGGPFTAGTLALSAVMLLAALAAPGRYAGLLVCADLLVAAFYFGVRFGKAPLWAQVEPVLTFWASFSSLAAVAWLLLHPEVSQANLLFANPILQGILSGAGVLLALFRLVSVITPLNSVLLLVNLAGVLAAGAKAPFLGLVLAAAVWIGGKQRRLVPLLALGVLLALLLPTPLQRIVRRAASGADIYAWDRVKIWQMDLRMVADHPLFGIGPENFGKVAKRYNFPQYKGASRYGKIPESPHSEYLNVLVATGLPGLLWLVLAGLAIGRRLWRPPRLDPGKLLVLYFLLQFSTMQFAFHPFFLLVVLALGRQLFAGEDRPLDWPWFSRGALLTSLLLVVGIAQLLPTVAQGQIRRADREADPLCRMSLLAGAARLDPLNPAIPLRVALNWGALFRTRGDPAALAAALDASGRARRLDPLDPAPPAFESSLVHYLWQRGIRYSGQQEEIETPLRRAIALDPFNPFLHLELAEFQWQGGRFAEARDSVDRALELEPEFVAARVFLHVRYGEWPDEAAFRQRIEQIRSQRGADRLTPGTYLFNLFRWPAEKA